MSCCRELTQLRQIIKRVLRHIVFPDLKVQVRSGHSSGNANFRDDLSLGHALPLLREVLPVMSVHRSQSLLVSNDDQIPVSSQFVAEDDLALFRGADACPRGGRDVDAVVKALLTRAKPGGEATLNWPDETGAFLLFALACFGSLLHTSR